MVLEDQPVRFLPLVERPRATTAEREAAFRALMDAAEALDAAALPSLAKEARGMARAVRGVMAGGR
jgi:hypothetical protein